MRLALLIAISLGASGVLYAQPRDSSTEKTIIESSLSEVWELSPEDRRGTFRLTSYKPFYLTLGRYTDRPNDRPTSENPAYSVPAAQAEDYNNFEARFQLSFKTKVLQRFLFGRGDLWVGFTQAAHWQIYNAALSRPFRELNYEPEIIVNFPLEVGVLGLNVRMAGASLNHQSNGRELPRSRSWNRLMVHVALEGERVSIFLKPWIRLPDVENENPRISSFVGRGEAIVVYRLRDHVIYMVGTNSLTIKDNRGGVQLNYVYPIAASLRAHLQVFHGYGETLIDYNHKQTTIGLGVSFVAW